MVAVHVAAAAHCPHCGLTTLEMALIVIGLWHSGHRLYIALWQRLWASSASRRQASLGSWSLRRVSQSWRCVRVALRGGVGDPSPPTFAHRSCRWLSIIPAPPARLWTLPRLQDALLMLVSVQGLEVVVELVLLPPPALLLRRSHHLREAGRSSKPRLQSRVAGTAPNKLSTSTHPLRMCARALRRYFKMLTVGCGDAPCAFQTCASNPSVCAVSAHMKCSTLTPRPPCAQVCKVTQPMSLQ